MIDRDRDGSACELTHAGFELNAHQATGVDGRTRYNLMGYGPYGGFFVSAPTMSAAYRAAIDQVRGHMIPIRFATRRGY